MFPFLSRSLRLWSWLTVSHVDFLLPLCTPLSCLRLLLTSLFSLGDGSQYSDPSRRLLWDDLWMRSLFSRSNLSLMNIGNKRTGACVFPNEETINIWVERKKRDIVCDMEGSQSLNRPPSYLRRDEWCDGESQSSSESPWRSSTPVLTKSC